MKVSSSQIENFPSVTTEVGKNVTITCAKTSGTIGEWKFRVRPTDSNLPVREILYTENQALLAQLGIAVVANESTIIDTITNMHNYSITLIDVQTNMTGMAIVCGAKSNETAEQSQPEFYSQAAVLIVNGGKYYYTI